jgi:Mg/Co/Ni transporter MgtE
LIISRSNAKTKNILNTGVISVRTDTKTDEVANIMEKYNTFVSLVLHKFGIEPALATGPFITTVNDVIGIFIYIGTGRLFYTFLQL